MDCKEIRSQLNELIDGEVTDTNREVLLSHIAQCPDCRREYEELKSIKKEFSKLNVQLDGALAESTMKKIYASAYPEKKKPFFYRHIGTAAALLLIAGLFIFGRANPEKDARTEAVNTSGEKESIMTVTLVAPMEKADAVIEESCDTETIDGNNFTVKSETESVSVSIADKPMSGQPEEAYPDTSLSDDVNNYRYSNSISNDTSIIFVDAKIETLTALFDDATEVTGNSITVDDHYTDVQKFLLSNSITVTTMDVYQSAIKTTVAIIEK